MQPAMPTHCVCLFIQYSTWNGIKCQYYKYVNWIGRSVHNQLHLWRTVFSLHLEWELHGKQYFMWESWSKQLIFQKSILPWFCVVHFLVSVPEIFQNVHVPPPDFIEMQSGAPELKHDTRVVSSWPPIWLLCSTSLQEMFWRSLLTFWCKFCLRTSQVRSQNLSNITCDAQRTQLLCCTVHWLQSAGVWKYYHMSNV